MRRPTTLRYGLYAQAGLALLLSSLWVGFLWTCPLDPDYAAGEILDHVMAWQSGQALYRSPLAPPFRVLVYPPLPWSPLLALGLWLGLTDKAARADLRWWYFAGTSVALLSTARVGASSQYFIEWAIATLLWVTPSLAAAVVTSRGAQPHRLASGAGRSRPSSLRSSPSM